MSGVVILLQGGNWVWKLAIFVLTVWIWNPKFQEWVWYYITAGKGSPVHLLSIPLLVCFPCSSNAGVSGAVVGWIHVPNPPAISTIWKLNPWSCVSVPVHPAGRGSGRDQNQLSCSWKCSLRLHFAGQSCCLWFGFLVVFVVLFWIFFNESCTLLLISRCS